MNNSLSTIAKQDATFTLVKSMSRSEKRTFKIMASTYKNATPDYVRLFDYMASQETYSDDVVKEHFKDEPFIAFFSARKKYLYYKIMESLRRHYDEKANKLGFYTTLRNVQILNDKGLTNLYEKEAHKLYKIADKHDLLLEKVIACKYLLGISERDHSTEGWANQQVYFENWTESTAQLAKFIEYTKKLH
ncbi:MAG: hypothetical protein ACPGXL_05585 [Chitinophagales bacterium]